MISPGLRKKHTFQDPIEYRSLSECNMLYLGDLSNLL